jgi:hypothetical protein
MRSKMTEQSWMRVQTTSYKTNGCLPISATTNLNLPVVKESQRVGAV